MLFNLGQLPKQKMRVDLLFASLVTRFLHSIVMLLELMSEQAFLPEHVFQPMRLIQANALYSLQTPIDLRSPIAILLDVLLPQLQMVLFIIDEAQQIRTVVQLSQFLEGKELSGNPSGQYSFFHGEAFAAGVFTEGLAGVAIAFYKQYFLLAVEHPEHIDSDWVGSDNRKVALP